jgi:type VI secretion system protein ImpC
MPISHWKNTDFAVFVGAQSLHKPAVYDDPDATSNANLGARLPYLFATCRFAHYLKCMVRDKIGGFSSKESLEAWLNKWISQFVDSNPASPDEVKAKFPLAEAQVVVEEDPSNPGVLLFEVLLEASLPVGRAHGVPAAGIKTALEQEMIQQE